MSSRSSISPKNRFSNLVLLTLEKLGYVEQKNCLKYLSKQAGNYSGNLRKSYKNYFFSWKIPINLKILERSLRWVYKDIFKLLCWMLEEDFGKNSLSPIVQSTVWLWRYLWFHLEKTAMSKLKMLQMEKAMWITIRNWNSKETRFFFR